MKPGDVLENRYELTKLIGKGGMAEVWEARDLQAQRRVAVKFLRPDQDPAGIEDEEGWFENLTALRGRFHREGALLGRLRHPGIPELFSQGSHGTDPYIIMRLIEGISLHHFLERHNPTVGAAAAIVAQAADALAHVHSVPVVHRDIKPYNLLIAQNGTVVLIDFGIAKPVSRHATPYTRHGSTVGSRGYQAPEQILERQVTPKTDLYALGCVLYELLAGRPPFTGDRLADQHLHEVPFPLLAHAPHIPTELEEITLRLLEKEPDRRPANAAIVRDVLSGYLPRPGDPAPSPRFDPDPTRPFRERAERWPPVAPISPDPAPGPARVGRAGSWLSRRQVQAALQAAENELVSGDLGTGAARVVELVPAAQRQWGRADPLARAVCKKAADSLRVAGDCGRAGILYQELADAVQCSDDPADQADLAEVLLGAAECRIPFGDLAPAMEAIATALRVLAELPLGPARLLAGRCREVGLELAELGHGTSIEELFDQLDGWERRNG
ncbi:MAG: protein kinase domain-containing protein [Streptosporangiaceae bacterium]